MALATLSVDLVAKLASLEAGLDKAGRLSQKTAAEIEANFQRLNAVGNKLGIAIGSAFSATVVRQFFSAVVDGIDAMNDVADATGATVENISALDDVARRTGTTLDVAASILVKFNNGLKEADGKNGVSLALKAIGLDAEALKKIDPAEALRQTAVALAGFADDGNKARLVQELFGKSVKEAAPFLKDLGEQTGLYGKVTEEATKQAEIFNKNIFALQANTTDLGRSIVNSTVPAINELIDRFKEGSKEGKGFFSILASRYMEVMRRDLPSMFTPRPTGDATRAALYGDAGYNAPLNRPSAGGGGGGGNGSKAKSYSEAVDSPLTVLSAYQEDFDKVFAKYQADLGKALEADGDFFNKKAQQDASYRQDAQVAIDAFAADYASETERLNISLIENDRARGLAQIELERKTAQARLDILASSGKDIADAQAQLDTNIATKTKTLEEDLDKKRVAGIQGAIKGGLLDLVDGDFKGIRDKFQQLLADLAADALAKDLTKYLFGGDGKTGLVGGFFASVLGSANGNAFGPGGVIPFAKGGVVDSATAFSYAGGKTGVMGEAGPEAILPLGRGPDGKLGVKGGGTVVNNYYNVAAGPTRGEVLTAIQQAVGASEARQNQRLRNVGMA